MSTDRHQPTIAELVARIQELEDAARARQRRRGLASGKFRAIAASIAVAVSVAVVPSFAGAAPSPVSWSLTGNAGTTPSTKYIGTSDAEGLSIRTNGTQAIGIDANQNVTVKGSLNAQGSLQDNGTPLSSKYAKVDGSNATGTWSINTTGNAGSVTNGLYSTGSYNDPSWMTGLAGSKITGNITGNAGGFTGGLSGDLTGGQGSAVVAKINGAPLGTTTGAGTGQVLKWNGTTWSPGADNTGLSSVSAGSTLNGDGTSAHPLGVNTNAIQARVTGTCVAGGISAVNADGSVACQPPSYNPLQVALLKWYTNTVTSFGTGSNPDGVAFDGSHIWVANQLGKTVSELNACDGSTVRTVGVGTDPEGVAFDGSHIWVANQGDNTVSELNASNGSTVRTASVGSYPRGLAFDGSHIWVANYGSNTVSELNAGDGSTVRTVGVGNAPDGVAFDGSHIWVANWASSTVSELNAGDGSTVRTVGVGNAPGGVAFDGSHIWVANWASSTVSKL